MRGEASRQEVAPWPFQRGGGSAAVCRQRGAEEAGRQAGGRGKQTDLQFQKFQGPYCKLAITFNLGLRWKSAQHESCSLFQDLPL